MPLRNSVCLGTDSLLANGLERANPGQGTSAALGRHIKNRGKNPNRASQFVMSQSRLASSCTLSQRKPVYLRQFSSAD